MSRRYELLDSGDQIKLERVGDVLLTRPAPQAFWPRSLPPAEWDRAQGIYERNSSGGGRWVWKRKPPASWEIDYAGFRVIVKTTDFGHLGFFPEQADNWARGRALAGKYQGAKVLNLFGYSGLMSMALAEGGASVCHVDAARGMVEWGNAIHALNRQVPNAIRWIVDDALKFAKREARRQSFYDAILLDPPKFGRGPNGEVWEFYKYLPNLLQACEEVLSPQASFLLLTAYAVKASALTLLRATQEKLQTHGGIITAGELVQQETGSQKYLSRAIYALWEK